MIAETARRGGGIIGFSGGSLLTEPGSDFQGFAGVGKAHQVQVALIHAFEIALGGVEHGFGQSVLAIAEGFGAGGGVKEVAPFIALVAILAVKPYGLFGKVKIERV